MTPQMDPEVKFVHFEGNSDLAEGDAATFYTGRCDPISIYTHPGRHPQHTFLIKITSQHRTEKC